MRRNNPEEQIQRAVVAHLHARAAYGVVWWHTPNGAYYGKNRGLHGAIMKAMGVRSGVADLLLFNGRLHALEIKAPGGRPTESQLAFLSDIDRAGGFGAIATGLDQAIETLITWQLLK